MENPNYFTYWESTSKYHVLAGLEKLFFHTGKETVCHFYSMLCYVVVAEGAAGIFLLVKTATEKEQMQCDGTLTGVTSILYV